MEDPRWGRVRELLDELYRKVLAKVGDLKVGRSNVLVEALVGRASLISRIERSLTTMLGEYAPRVFAVFFSSAEPLQPPFDFYGVLRGREYWVKVVSGEDAFNSAVRGAVADASLRYPNPVILTLQGRFFEPVRVGRAPWLSAPASWRFVAGEGAYQRFAELVREVASRYRDRLWEVVKS